MPISHLFSQEARSRGLHWTADSRVPWAVPPMLVSAGAAMAAALDVHLVCAYVDPSSVLTEWEPYTARTAASLDPAVNEEAPYPAGEVRARLGTILHRTHAARSAPIPSGRLFGSHDQRQDVDLDVRQLALLKTSSGFIPLAHQPPAFRKSSGSVPCTF